MEENKLTLKKRFNIGKIYKPISVPMTVLIIATMGAFIQIVGASWDVTFHLLKRPETFFTPPHGMLYSGVGLLIISAIISAGILLKNKDPF